MQLGRRHGPSPSRARGFTLVEILISIVLVGILSAVVVVGVGRLTQQGTSAACAASKDAARAAATTHWASTGAYPGTFTDMTAATPPSITLPSKATVDGTGRILRSGSWALTLVPGTGANPPTFLCDDEPPAGFSIGPNGNFYRFVSSTSGWSAAASEAATFTNGTSLGHLATITSAAENDFVVGLAAGRSVWIDGSDSTQEGVWRWTAGPETGQQFLTGPTPFNDAYVRWTGIQPDNAGGGEHCLHIYAPFGSRWNDVSCNWPNNSGYVVEISR